ncbi:MAG: flagellar assembly protein FliH [Pseudomonadales bacterium]|nr:flagellar assembly protein FliH [Pseudomonadales bacterium]
MEKQKDSKNAPFLSKENSSEETLSAFERWELPTMDGDIPKDSHGNAFSSEFKNIQPVAPSNQNQPSEEIDEEIKPLTAEDLEAIRQAAFEEGKAEGEQAGYKAGYDQGYKSGEADVKAATTKLAQISRALLDPIPAQDDELEAALLELVQNVCTRVVHRELKADSSSILLIVKEALNCLNHGSERVRIHLNPQDSEFVIESLKDSGDWDESWRFLAHQTISPGGCIVDTDNAVIDSRAEKRLATVIKQVYEQDPKALDQEEQPEAGLDQLLGEVSAFEEDEDNSEIEDTNNDDKDIETPDDEDHP